MHAIARELDVILKVWAKILQPQQSHLLTHYERNLISLIKTSEKAYLN